VPAGSYFIQQCFEAAIEGFQPTFTACLADIESIVKEQRFGALLQYVALKAAKQTSVSTCNEFHSCLRVKTVVESKSLDGETISSCAEKADIRYGGWSIKLDANGCPEDELIYPLYMRRHEKLPFAKAYFSAWNECQTPKPTRGETGPKTAQKRILLVPKSSNQDTGME
jgi:hypothetical protein